MVAYARFVFCLHNVLPQWKELGIFVTKPITNFKMAVEKIDRFHEKKFHE